MTTLFHDTMLALEQSLHCSLIASELDFKKGVFSLDAPDDAILDYALPRRFSRVGLYEQWDAPETITHVALVDLAEGSITSRPHLTVDDVIAGETPVAQAIDLLSKRPFYFLLEGYQVRRIVTVSDLNRLPVRTYLHVLLDHLEGLLADWIDVEFPGDSWLDRLDDKAQTRICALHKRKERVDFDTRLVDCTTLSDKGAVMSEALGLQVKLTETTDGMLDKHDSLIVRLRNRLDHGMPPLDKNADELRNHVRHHGQFTKRADVAWLSRTVEVLRAWIEALAGEEDAG